MCCTQHDYFPLSGALELMQDSEYKGRKIYCIKYHYEDHMKKMKDIIVYERLRTP